MSSLSFRRTAVPVHPLTNTRAGSGLFLSAPTSGLSPTIPIDTVTFARNVIPENATVVGGALAFAPSAGAHTSSSDPRLSIQTCELVFIVSSTPLCVCFSISLFLTFSLLPSSFLPFTLAFFSPSRLSLAFLSVFLSFFLSLAFLCAYIASLSFSFLLFFLHCCCARFLDVLCAA